MSIDRIHGEVVFTCDACDDTLETAREDFNEALTVMRGDGWRSELVAGAWVHACPDCRKSDSGSRSNVDDFA